MKTEYDLEDMKSRENPFSTQLKHSKAMPFTRQIYNDLPDSIATPVELRHRKVEIIILPLDETEESQNNSYQIVEVDKIIKYSREELHER